MNNFLEKRYNDIILMSKKICKSSPEFEDVAHFAITEFMQHERGQELVDANKAMQFLSGIIHRSFWSSSSQYHTLYRQKGRVHSLKADRNDMNDNDYFDYTQNKGNRRVNEMQDNEYNHDVDAALEAIEAILEEMIIESKEQWYRSVMFQHWIEDPNYSAISKRLNIPRTSVARAVKEARIHIQTTLKNRGIEYEL